MKTRLLSIILALVFVFGMIPAPVAFAQETDVIYVSSTGEISGIPTEKVRSNIDAALRKIGNSEGIIYISGNASLPSVIGEDIEGAGKITFRGYNGTSDRILLSAGYSTFTRDVVFENISIKPYANDERWLSARNCTVTIEDSCKTELSDSYVQNNVSKKTGLYIGVDSAFSGDSHYVLKDSDATVTMIAPVGGYGRNYTVNGDTRFDLYAGTYTELYGVARNGDKNTQNQDNFYQTINGDVTYNIFGGNYNSFYTGSTYGGNINGNVVFNFYGGSFSKHIWLGDSNKNYNSKTKIGNTALIFDGEQLRKNASNIYNISVTQQTDFGSMDKKTTSIIFNHAENEGRFPNVTATSFDYFFKVYGGKASPVYADSVSGNTGELLGFDFVSDDPILEPYVQGGDFLSKNANGYYDVPKSSVALTVNFGNRYSGMKFTATFKSDNKKAAEDISADGNTYYTLPLCTVTKKDQYFDGWSDGTKTYAAGEKVLARANVSYSALFTSVNNKKAVYVCSTGDDSNTGFSEYAPLKTFEKAAQTAYNNGLSKIVIKSAVETNALSLPQFSSPLTITGEGFDGSLYINGTFNLNSPVNFEHMGLANKQYNFLVTNCYDVVFGEGLKAINGKGIELHAGYNEKTAENINCTVKSGQFDSVYFGGAYFTQQCVGVSGNITLNLENVKGFDLKLGFDGYPGHDAYASIDGNIFVNLKNSTLSSVTTDKVTEIKGSLIIVSDGNSSYPEESALPDVKSGKYFIFPSEDVTVSAAEDGNGTPVHGAFKVTCESENAKIKVSTNAQTNYYEQGIISLDAGTYRIGKTSFDFEISAPIVGLKAEKKTVTTSDYRADIVWYIGNSEASEFKASRDYVAKIIIDFYEDADPENISVNVNGRSYAAVKDGDTYTVSVPFARTSKENNTVYVKSSGTASNSGTSSTKPTTMAKALETLKNTGGLIYVLDKVTISGTLGQCRYPILISGKKSETAELFIPASNGVTLSNNITFENISITMGEYANFNDLGHKIVFDDSVVMSEGQLLHLGALSETNVVKSNAYIGKQSVFNAIYAGGAYIETGSLHEIAEDITIENSGTVNTMYFSLDAFKDTHMGALLKGNVLVTMNEGSKIASFGKNAQSALVFSENSVVQFILNGNASIPAMPDWVVPSDKLYIVNVTGQGNVFHALDENGKSVSGAFDIIPDDGYVAVIEGSNRLYSASRHTFEAGKVINVSFMKCDASFNECVVDTDGGKAYGELFRVDENRNITFPSVPEKEGYIFEGWYSDSARTKLVKDGSLAGESISLYAKYIPVSFEVADEEFVVKGVQIRLPSEEKTQGLRFVLAIDKAVISEIAAFSSKNASLTQGVNYDVSYGSTVLPKLYLGTNRLENGAEYIYDGTAYYSKAISAKKLFAVTDDKIYYTVCITGIDPEEYENTYMVSPYITYYTRSGNKATVYGNVYGTGVIPAAFEMLDQGNETDATNTYLRENMMTLYAQNRGIETISQTNLKAINDKTELYKEKVLESVNIDTSKITGTVYYVSNSGSDSNTGKKNTKDNTVSPWATIDKVNQANLKPGDAVLFERGGEFRGKIVAKQGVTYSAYGVGDKPIINGSARDYADASLWSETPIKNVYKLNTKIYGDAGLIAFDHGRTPGDYDELYSTKRVSGIYYNDRLFEDQFDLSSDLEFFHDGTDYTVYLYSKYGNPGSRFTKIEIATTGNLVDVSVPDVTVDNLHFRYGGAHGVGGGAVANYENGVYKGLDGCSNLKVTNCIFAWIGGSLLEGTTRFGNAVEIYGSADGYTVENNWIYQIYDTGITHQLSANRCENSMMKDIDYKNNLVEYCHWSIEFYNQPCCEAHKRIVQDVLVSENIVRMGGYGWGSTIRQQEATLYNSFGLSNVPEETQSFRAENNIFFRCTGPIYRLNTNASERNLTFDGNVHIQDYEAPFSWYCGETYDYKNVDSYLGSGLQINDNNAKDYFYAP